MNKLNDWVCKKVTFFIPEKNLKWTFNLYSNNNILTDTTNLLALNLKNEIINFALIFFWFFFVVTLKHSSSFDIFCENLREEVSLFQFNFSAKLCVYITQCSLESKIYNQSILIYFIFRAELFPIMFYLLFIFLLFII